MASHSTNLHKTKAMLPTEEIYYWLLDYNNSQPGDHNRVLDQIVATTNRLSVEQKWSERKIQNTIAEVCRMAQKRNDIHPFMLRVLMSNPFNIELSKP